MVEAETGSLTPPDDVTAMAEATARWLSDDTGRRAAGAASRDRVEAHFSLESEADGINAVYQALWDAG